MIESVMLWWLHVTVINQRQLVYSMTMAVRSLINVNVLERYVTVSVDVGLHSWSSPPFSCCLLFLLWLSRLVLQLLFTTSSTRYLSDTKNSSETWKRSVTGICSTTSITPCCLCNHCFLLLVLLAPDLLSLSSSFSFSCFSFSSSHTHAHALSLLFPFHFSLSLSSIKEYGRMIHMLQGYCLLTPLVRFKCYQQAGKRFQLFYVLFCIDISIEYIVLTQ